MVNSGKETHQIDGMFWGDADTASSTWVVPVDRSWMANKSSCEDVHPILLWLGTAISEGAVPSAPLTKVR